MSGRDASEPHSETEAATPGFSVMRLLPWAALAVMWVASYFGWVWLFAILFIAWTIPDLRSGHTHLMGPVSRAERPMLYWSIIASWWLLSIAWVVYS